CPMMRNASARSWTRGSRRRAMCRLSTSPIFAPATPVSG
ncbi:MAG: hypothetical protein AVDCRST_MAG33-1462, partial [uncultured Thermomicrobiales bacterium]